MSMMPPHNSTAFWRRAATFPLGISECTNELRIWVLLCYSDYVDFLLKFFLCRFLDGLILTSPFRGPQDNMERVVVFPRDAF